MTDETKNQEPQESEKLRALREALLAQANGLAELAKSPTLKEDDSAVFGFHDDPETPLDFTVTPGGEFVVLHSGDGLGIAFRFQDLPKVVRRLNNCLVEAGAQMSVLKMSEAIAEVIGDEAAQKLISDAQAVVLKKREERKAKLDALEKSLNRAVGNVEQVAEKLQELADKKGEPEPG